MPQINIENRISEILKKICKEKGFLGAIVCTDDGLAIASYARRQAAEQVEGKSDEFDLVVSALGGLFLTVASRARQELRFKQVEELFLRGESGLRVTFRVFQSAFHGNLVLGVLMDHSVPYRRLTSKAIRLVQDAIDSE